MLKEVATIKQDNNINNNRKTIHSQEKCPVYKKKTFFISVELEMKCVNISIFDLGVFFFYS